MSTGERVFTSFLIIVFLFFTVIIWIKPGIVQSLVIGLSIFVAIVVTNYIAKKKNNDQQK